MPSLFISRSLPPDSLLIQWAMRRGIDVMDQSLLRFSPLPFQLPKEDFDWIFFYSPRAVEFFWTPIAIGRGRQRAQQAKLAAIGPSTARTLLSLGYQLDFAGNGQPTETATAFGELAAGQTVLFPRAQKSRQSVQKLLGDRIQSLDLVVYQNEAVPPVHPIGADAVVLTSPLNVKAWFATHDGPAEDQYFVAIGPTTARALEQYGVASLVASSPTEAGILQELRRFM